MGTSRSMADISAIETQRNERDTKELQKMIGTHFEGRKLEDEDFQKFNTHLEERKARRAGDVEARAEKEKMKREAEDAEKKARDEAESAAKASLAESKAAAFVPDKTSTSDLTNRKP